MAGTNREFLRRVLRENGLSSRGTEYLVDNSRFFYGTASLRPGSVPVYSLIAEGAYSGSLVEFGIRREPGWEKTEISFGPIRTRYYREKDGPGQIAAPSDTLVILSSGDIEECLSRLYTPHRSPLPPEILARFETVAAAAFLPSTVSGGVLGGLSKTLGLGDAWENLLVTAESREDAGYTFSGNLKMAPNRDGRAPALLLRLFLSGWLASRGRTFADIRSGLKVESTANTIEFSGVILSEDETAGLIQSMLRRASGDGIKQ